MPFNREEYMKFFALLTALILSGCALTPEEIRGASVQRLCDQYALPGSPQFMDPRIRAELLGRGAEHCTTPEYLQARAAASQVDLGLALQLLQQGQRQTYVPAAPLPALQQPVRCTSRYNAITKTVETICN